MIRIENNKLVIQLECHQQEPLFVLAEYQKGLIDLLHIANLNTGQNAKEEVENAVHFSTNLLKELMISEDQLSVLSKNLSESQIKEFNRWA